MRHVLTQAFLILSLAPAARAQDATLQSLLTEVKQLRLAIERSTLLGTRTQIAMERLQVEDTRSSRSAQELQNARRELLDAQSHQARLTAEIKEQEEAVTRVQNNIERTALEQEIKHAKLDLETFAAREPQLRAREAELSAQLNSAHSRVAELEGHILDMERALDAAVRQLTAP